MGLCCCTASHDNCESNKRAALYNYLRTEHNLDLSISELDCYILSSKEYNDDAYYLILDNELVNDKTIDYVYLLKLYARDGVLVVEKASADYSLDSPQPVKDADFTPYNEWTCNVDGVLGFTIGKVYDDSLKPFYNNKPLPLNENGIFFVWFDSNNPQMSIIYNT